MSGTRHAGVALLVLALGAACRLEVRPPERSASGAVDATMSTADSVAIMNELRSYYRDMSARDWTAFAAHFWPGADISTVWQPPGEPEPRVVISSVPDFVAQAPAGPGSRAVFEERMVGARITGSGHLAQAWVRYRARFGDPGAIEEWEGVDAFTLIRHEGRWGIVELAFAPSGAGAGVR
jgi:hypothetical protein